MTDRDCILYFDNGAREEVELVSGRLSDTKSVEVRLKSDETGQNLISLAQLSAISKKNEIGIGYRGHRFALLSKDKAAHPNDVVAVVEPQMAKSQNIPYEGPTWTLAMRKLATGKRKQMEEQYSNLFPDALMMELAPPMTIDAEEWGDRKTAVEDQEQKRMMLAPYEGLKSEMGLLTLMLNEQKGDWAKGVIGLMSAMEKYTAFNENRGKEHNLYAVQLRREVEKLQKTIQGQQEKIEKLDKEVLEVADVLAIDLNDELEG